MKKTGHPLVLLGGGNRPRTGLTTQQYLSLLALWIGGLFEFLVLLNILSPAYGFTVSLVTSILLVAPWTIPTAKWIIRKHRWWIIATPRAGGDFYLNWCFSDSNCLILCSILELVRIWQFSFNFVQDGELVESTSFSLSWVYRNIWRTRFERETHNFLFWFKKKARTEARANVVGNIQYYSDGSMYSRSCSNTTCSSCVRTNPPATARASAFEQTPLQLEPVFWALCMRM